MKEDLYKPVGAPKNASFIKISVDQPFLLNGKILVFPGQNEIRMNHSVNSKRQLEPRLMKLLQLLAERPGETFSRKQLLKAVWEERESLDEVLTLAVSRLRKALGDQSRSSTYIQTLPRKGYRLIASVEPLPASSSISPSKRTRGFLFLLGAIIFTTSIFLFALLNRQKPPQALSILPITNTHGLEIEPVVSGDSRYLAFSERKNDAQNFNLFLKEMHSGKSRNMSQQLEGDCLSPAWSPLSEEIAFVHYWRGRVAVKRLRLADGRVEQIVECHPRATPELDWSSDGRWLAFTDRTVADFSQKIFLFDFKNNRKVFWPTGEGEAFQAVFSPDAENLLFVRQVPGKGYQIVERELFSGEEKVWIEETRRIGNICWKGNRQLLYTAGRGLLYELDFDKNETHFLGLDYLDELSWSEKEQTLFATRYQSDKNIWKSASGSPSMFPFQQSTRKEAAPCVTPDARRIAFVSDRSGREQIWWSDAENEQLQQGTRFVDEGRFGGKSWSPDGTTLAFVRKERGNAALWILNVESLELRQLLESKQLVEFPQWKADGSALYCLAKLGGVEKWWCIAIDGSAPQALIGVPKEAAFVQINSTADTLYFTKTGQPGIWRKSLPHGETELFHCNLDWKDFDNWLLLPQQIYFLDRSAHSVQIASINLASKKEVVLLQLPGGNKNITTRIAADASGKWIYFDQLDLLDTDILALGNSGNE